MCEGAVNMSGIWLCTSQELAKANKCKYLNQNGCVNYGGLIYHICRQEERTNDHINPNY